MAMDNPEHHGLIYHVNTTVISFNIDIDLMYTSAASQKSKAPDKHNSIKTSAISISR